MYDDEQIGEKLIRPISGRSKDRYRLYVKRTPTSNHEPILIGVDWWQCRMRTVEMISRGVDWFAIYGDIASNEPALASPRHDPTWGNARHHLWWSIDDGANPARAFADVMGIEYR